MTVLDASAAARLFRDHMPESSLARFGHRFLSKLLGTMALSRYVVAYACEDSLSLTGFIMASVDIKKLRSELAAQWRMWARNIPWRIFSDAGAIKDFFELCLYPGVSMADGTVPELLFIVIDPAWRRKGIARQLIHQTLATLGDRGLRRVLVSTLENNIPVNTLLTDMGFRQVRAFRFRGRRNIFYEYTQREKQTPSC